MITTFADRDTRTICDLTPETLPDGTPGYCVNRVNTPADHRGRGHASRLMREQVLPAADAEGAVLHLWIQPTGALGYDALAEWYHRLGFRPRDFDYDDGSSVQLWVRQPVEQRLLNGPTRNHVLSYVQPPLAGMTHTFWFALCGYRTCDEERVDNPDWRVHPMCRRCQKSIQIPRRRT